MSAVKCLPRGRKCLLLTTHSKWTIPLKWNWQVPVLMMSVTFRFKACFMLGSPSKAQMRTVLETRIPVWGAAIVTGICYSVCSEWRFPQFAADGCYCLPQYTGSYHTVGEKFLVWASRYYFLSCLDQKSTSPVLAMCKGFDCCCNWN